MRTRILFADSSATIQQVVELAFENEDISVTAVSSGEEALSMLEEITPDIIIADEGLGGISGIELCKKIKESALFSLIPFIMLKKDEGEVETPPGYPAPDDYLLKPFKSEELVQKVKEHLPESYETENIAGEQEQAGLHQLVSKETLPALNEAEEKSLYETDDFISLTGEAELSPDEKRADDQLPELEISSTEEEIPEEEVNISGLLAEEEVLSGIEEIEKRNSELDEIFRFNAELEVDKVGSDDRDEEGAEGLFEEQSASSVPSAQRELLPAKELEAIIKSSLEKSLNDLNEKIMREELQSYLNRLTPELIKSIEKIIWEIMPGLAESLIKKEIEKIKNG